MYVIVEIQGQQFKVEKDQKLFVHHLEGEEGSQVEFGKVFLADSDGAVTVGTPVMLRLEREKTTVRFFINNLLYSATKPCV